MTRRVRLQHESIGCANRHCRAAPIGREPFSQYRSHHFSRLATAWTLRRVSHLKLRQPTESNCPGRDRHTVAELPGIAQPSSGARLVEQARRFVSRCA